MHICLWRNALQSTTLLNPAELTASILGKHNSLQTAFEFETEVLSHVFNEVHLRSAMYLRYENYFS